jgi:hypothetical protein
VNSVQTHTFNGVNYDVAHCMLRLCWLNAIAVAVRHNLGNPTRHGRVTMPNGKPGVGIDPIQRSRVLELYANGSRGSRLHPVLYDVVRPAMKSGRLHHRIRRVRALTVTVYSSVDLCRRG